MTWNTTDLGHMRELDIQCFHWNLALWIRIQVYHFKLIIEATRLKRNVFCKVHGWIWRITTL